MSELFDDDEDKVIDAEAQDIEEDAPTIVLDGRQRPHSDARRRLENLLEEKRLRDELEDFLDF